MTVQVTKSGITVLYTDDEMEQMSVEFNRKHCIKLSKFFKEDFLCFIQEKINQCGEFYEVNYPASGQDNPMLRLKDKKTEYLLRFIINDQKLFQFIEQITDCNKIGSFTGRICSMKPNLGHRDAWHNDLVDNRMIALSVNLSTEIYEGGILQIRDENTKEIVHEVANTGFGDAIIFKIDPSLNHRLTEVTGSVSRTFFAGWFRSEPIYFQNPEDKLLVFNPETTDCIGLDNIGATIFQMLKKPQSLIEIKNKILSEYNVEADKCEEDLVNLIQKLNSNGLVSVTEEKYSINSAEVALKGI